MNKQVQNWLVVGVIQNWETALSQPVPLWGLKTRYQAEFQTLNIGDMLWFYATAPVKGVIGLGVIKDKYTDDMNLVWDDELKQKEVIWPLRFRIHVLKMISRNQWKTDCIKINDFNLIWQMGFQLLKDEHVSMLIERSKILFNGVSERDLFSGATITETLKVREKAPSYIVPEKVGVSTHRDLQLQIAEIGKLQYYHTQIEYPIELTGENKNLDVVWKREISGVPTLAFEVELSGGIEKAITRLKFAYSRWNSRPRIVVPKDFSKKVHNVLATEDRNFVKEFRMYETRQIIELLNKKRELKTLEQNLGIY